MNPNYHDIAQVMRSWIKSGTYGPGDRLPAHADIARQLGVSRPTVVNAVRVLVQEGLLQTGGSRGTWVRERVLFWSDATAYDDVNTRMRSGDAFNSAVSKDGRTPSTRFSMRSELPPDHVAVALGVPTDELVVIRQVRQLVDEHPWSLATSYYPMDLARDVGLDTPHDIPEGTVRRMNDRGYGETGSLDEVTTRPPTEDETRELGISPGTSMLVWTRTAGTDERITRVTEAIMPGDRNALRFRQGSDAAIGTILAARNVQEDS